jgi:hypothetical protein
VALLELARAVDNVQDDALFARGGILDFGSLDEQRGNEAEAVNLDTFTPGNELHVVRTPRRAGRRLYGPSLISKLA